MKETTKLSMVSHLSRIDGYHEKKSYFALVDTFVVSYNIPIENVYKIVVFFVAF